MTNDIRMINRQRLKAIEDRKIEILLEIGKINDYKSSKILELTNEYARLDQEYFQIRAERIAKNSK